MLICRYNGSTIARGAQPHTTEVRLPSCPAKWLELEWHCLWEIYGIFAEYILFVEAPGAWTLGPFSHAFVQEVPNCQSGVLRHAGDLV
jgi:hypothetical protein